ncbi:MAG: exodeoxyribonuclease V subunit gamma [Deltaproteobacteria bacterium]|nr:exodeoxyribonuclease V subunit gamma [Deltaproteobacteria bacterium]
MEKGLRLYTSNRMEILADFLSQVLREPLPSPLEQEIIVVQSTGMERWLRMQIAVHHGVCANVRFPFPNAFIRDISHRVLGFLPEKAFDPAVLTWRIFDLLPASVELPGFEPVSAYLDNKRRELKQYQLAATIADLFDQYLIFRPEMISSWEKGKENHWQAVLWRKLVEKEGAVHRAALHRQLIEALDRGEVPTPDILPRRISVFGIATLPPFHIQVLSALSAKTQVNLFLMNPCREYWGEILSERQKQAFLRKSEQHRGGEELLHLEEGNSLLASMGTLGRDFFSMVTELQCDEKQAFEDKTPTTMLQVIQSDILNLKDRGSEGQEKAVISRHDHSLQIHSCHSPMREMEVLHDRLLFLFEQDPMLEPRHILVMAPDIERYAPFVQAVFAAPEKGDTRIPFSIADRSPKSQNLLVDPYLFLLDLSRGRFTAAEVMSLLECAAVRSRFGLSEDDLFMIQSWIRESGIRWGRDADHRQGLGLPPFSEHTWRFGLDRLLLGYAMPGSGKDRIFKDILPYDRVEGADALVLGRFAAFVEALISRTASLQEPRTLPAWSETLTDLLDSFFSQEPPWERETQMIRDVLTGLNEQAAASKFQRNISIDPVKSHLVKQLVRKSYGSGFMTGGVTFCSMLPMRSIPFKVICLLGMNNDAYPRQTKKLGFDLMAKNPRRGDRSRRNDDRYLFLETILSARDTLSISYVGQSSEDNSAMPPSVLVSELIDYLEQNFRCEDPSISLEDHLFFRHRLQAFSPAYFTGSEKYFSYSQENLDAARQKIEPSRQGSPFIATRLSPPDEQWKSIDLSRFLAFFAHPARFLLKERLGILLGRKDTRMEESEPFAIDGLEQYKLDQRILSNKMAGKESRRLLKILRAEGYLPHGTPGECAYERLREGAETFAQKVREQTQQREPTSLEIDFLLKGLTVKGRIDGIYPHCLIQYRYAKAKAKDHVTLWIKHLFFNLSEARKGNGESILLAADGTWRYAPVDSPMKILEQMARLFLSGLEKPLSFFPETSLVYARALIERKKEQAYALEKARERWLGNEFRPGTGEGQDEYYQLGFGNTDPLDEAFRDLAIEFYTPLLSAMEKIG